MPQEEMLEVTKTNKELFIGIPKECTLQENRVALVPEAVARLVLNGHRVIIESEAGKGAHFEDRDYSDAGAKIAYDKKEVYESDIIIKVDPPTLDEIEMMKPKQCLISALQLSVHPENYLKRLMKKQITAIAVDFIKGYDGGYPFVRSMSEIAGNTVILIAAEYLSNVNSGKGLMMGGVTGLQLPENHRPGAGTRLLDGAEGSQVPDEPRQHHDQTRKCRRSSLCRQRSEGSGPDLHDHPDDYRSRGEGGVGPGQECQPGDSTENNGRPPARGIDVAEGGRDEQDHHEARERRLDTRHARQHADRCEPPDREAECHGQGR